MSKVSPSVHNAVQHDLFPRGLQKIKYDRRMAEEPHRAAGLQEFSSVWRVSRLAGGKLEHQGAPSIRGNQMNLGGASTPGSANGLRAVFFSAPVPSG